MTDHDLQRICYLGTIAWQRLREDQTWNDWLTVGEALRVGRAAAMKAAGTNRPEGAAYNAVFGRWLAQYKLNDMDKGDRSRLFTVMDNLPAIEAWRQTLAQNVRMKLNHPTSVLRKWKRDTQISPDDPTKRQTQREANIEFDTENHDLQEHIKEIESDRDNLKSESDSLRADVAAKDTYIKQLEEMVADQRLATNCIQSEYDKLEKQRRWAIETLIDKRKRLKETKKQLDNALTNTLGLANSNLDPKKKVDKLAEHLRVCPETLDGIAEFSEHETN